MTVYFADHGPKMTIGTIVGAIGDALEEDPTGLTACDVIDDLLLDSTAHELKSRKLKADIRGVIVAMYRAGKAAGIAERLLTDLNETDT